MYMDRIFWGIFEKCINVCCDKNLVSILCQKAFTNLQQLFLQWTRKNALYGSGGFPNDAGGANDTKE